MAGLPKILGIIAGGGDLPAKLVDACRAQDITPYVIGIQGQANEALCDTVMPVGMSGKIMAHLTARDISDLVFIGKMKRPSWGDLRMDFKTLRFFTRVGLNALGDDGLLRAMRRELEGEGFTLHGVHKFLPGLLAPEGVIGAVSPTDEQQAYIDLGIKASQDLGRRDLGQSVIVNGEHISEEDHRGTDALIRGANGGILVKTCKPQQDRDLDLPTIGAKTVQAAHDAQLSGIVVQAGATLVADRDEVVKLADQYGMFVVGVSL